MRLIIISLNSNNDPMKRHTTLALLSATLFAVTHAGAFELEHSDGTLSLDTTPQKVVSFDIGVLDTLAALNVPVAGVPRSTYSGPLAPYQNSTVVGTLFEPDYEVLRELEPDLIIAGRRSLDKTDELNKLAPTVNFHSEPVKFLQTFRETNLALGRAFGKQEQAAAALASLDAGLKTLHGANQGKTGALLFVVKGNIIPHAPGDRFGYAYEIAGLQSVLPAKDPHAPVPPRPQPNSAEAKAAAEQRAQILADIAAAEPDWLLVLDRGAINNGERTAAETLAKHPQLAATRAFKEDRVVYLDPNGWYIVGGGLNNMRAIVQSLLENMNEPR